MTNLQCQDCPCFERVCGGLSRCRIDGRQAYGPDSCRLDAAEELVSEVRHAVADLHATEDSLRSVAAERDKLLAQCGKQASIINRLRSCPDEHTSTEELVRRWISANDTQRWDRQEELESLLAFRWSCTPEEASYTAGRLGRKYAAEGRW